MAEPLAVPPGPVRSDAASGPPTNPDQLPSPADDCSLEQYGSCVLISVIIFVGIVGPSVIFAATEQEDVTGTPKWSSSSHCQRDPDEVGHSDATKCNAENFFPEKEEPSLICSLRGSHVLPLVEQLCSHLVFLEATLDAANRRAFPASGTTKGLQVFKSLKKPKGTLKKLISFPADDVSTMSADDIDESFHSIRGGWLDGIDIRYMSGNESSRAFQELQALAERKKYIIHGVFDSVNIDTMKHFHVASLRVYFQTSRLSFKALVLQEEEEVESQAKEYATAVASTNLSPFGNHCIAFTIAALKYQPGVSELFSGGTQKLNYCSEAYNRSCSATFSQGTVMQYQKIGTTIFAYDTPRGFQVKLNKIRFLPNACILLDDVSYDYNKCECTVRNFRLLRVAREFLWGSTGGSKFRVLDVWAA